MNFEIICEALETLSKESKADMIWGSSPYFHIGETIEFKVFYHYYGLKWNFRRQKTMIPEKWKPVFRNTETDFVGLITANQKLRNCQAQSRLRCVSRFDDDNISNSI